MRAISVVRGINSVRYNIVNPNANELYSVAKSTTEMIAWASKLMVAHTSTAESNGQGLIKSKRIRFHKRFQLKPSKLIDSMSINVGFLIFFKYFWSKCESLD